MLLLGRSDEGWLEDNEVYCEFDEFVLFFDQISAAWKEPPPELRGTF